MKRTGMKKTLAALVTVGILSIGVATFAATALSPAEIASKLTGKDLAVVQQERTAGKTYGTIAKDADKIEEFKDEMLKNREAAIKERVANGQMTQEDADKLLEAMKERMATCDGTGMAAGGLGQKFGAAFGQGGGRGNGQGAGRMLRDGTGMAAGRGMMNRAAAPVK